MQAEITPLISQYTSKFVRWFRIGATLLVFVAIAWIAFQIFAQVSLFEWIGDRIDNLTDEINEDAVSLGLVLVA